MPGTTHLECYTPTGQSLGPIVNWTRLECTLSEMQIGTLVLEVPPTYDGTFFQRDGRIAYRRDATPLQFTARMQLVGNTTWLIARRQLIITREQTQTIRITCVHPNALLARRVVAYAEASAQAKKTALADDMIKAVVRENFTAATDTARNWSATFFAVEADTGASGSIDKEMSYRTVLPVCQEIAGAASAGVYTGFEVFSPLETGPYTLRTYTGQRGTDRSSASGQVLTLGIAYGTLGDMELDENWMEMVSFAYASGSGKKSERVVQSASDAALIAASPYGRIEWLQNVTQTTDTAVLLSEAARAIRERRPRLLFTGVVQETAYATFMTDYDWGDRVVGEFPASLRATGFTWAAPTESFDCRVDPVKITVERAFDETGEVTETESLDIRLRGEAAIT